jgi:hypothetical protein
MNKKTPLLLIVTAMLAGILVHAFGQTAVPKQPIWLEPQNPNRLEWLVLQKQADEGDTEFGDNNVTVHFYLGPDSYRTGEILCDLEYLPNTRAQLVQIIEDSILKRFEMQHRLNPWARVKIIKKAAKL